MPGLTAFNRRWSVGSDDFVFPGGVLSVFHLIWWVFFVFKKETKDRSLQNSKTLIKVTAPFLLFGFPRQLKTSSKFIAMGCMHFGGKLVLFERYTFHPCFVNFLWVLHMYVRVCIRKFIFVQGSILVYLKHCLGRLLIIKWTFTFCFIIV